MIEQDIKTLLTNHHRRLQKLKETKTILGYNTPPEVLTEIEDIEEEIEQLNLQLNQDSISPPIDISDDDHSTVIDIQIQRPVPSFDTNLLKSLNTPGGAVKLDDNMYIEREADSLLKNQLLKSGTTTTIRAPRQTGKTSLLARGVDYASKNGANIIFIDFQQISGEKVSSLELFLQDIAETICYELNFDEEIMESVWERTVSGGKKLTRFIEKNILLSTDKKIILVMDEADSLLQTDFYKEFFALLRSWHNRRATHPIWNRVNIVLVISTEPYLLIDNIHQSPFNVGLHLNLTDFNESQVRDLNKRHNSPVKEIEIPHLMKLLCGHPFLTVLALYEMVTKKISWTELTDNIMTDTTIFDDHLRQQYWIIREKTELKNALKEIISTGRCSNEKALFRLLKAGLIKGNDDAYMCRCDLYSLYFKDKLF